MRAVPVLALAIPFLLACGGFPPYELPEQRSSGEPLMEAPNPRTGELAWRSGSFETTPEGVTLQFTLMNGTTRNYVSVVLRVILLGPGREMATARYPVGPMAGGSSRVVRAHLGPPGFEVNETRLELIYAQE
jgi:hypothetical protein